MTNILKNQDCKVKIMGIINATPDSFSNDGILQQKNSISTMQRVVLQAQNFADAGCDILDIGGESSRPGCQIITAEQEIQRVVPVIEHIREVLPTIDISVDTYKSSVAEAAIQAGANIINDIWGGTADTKILDVAKKHNVPICLMHNTSNAENLDKSSVVGKSYSAENNNSNGSDFIAQLKKEMHVLAQSALNAGIPSHNIWLDPGVGFGKTIQQNIEIIANIKNLKTLGFPVLLGASRKSFIGHILGTDIQNRVEGTLATTAMATLQGTDVIRVHDVIENIRIVKMTNALQNSIL